MKTFWKDDHVIRLTLIGVSLTLIYLTILFPLGFLGNARAASTDALLKWRSTLQKPPSQKEDILLVMVDDESQRHLNQKWPWDRTLFAQLVRQIVPLHPRLVLFDFAFVGESKKESDAAFADAVREGPPILLGAYFDPKWELMMPQPLFVEAGGIPGLINKLPDRDQITRRMITSVHAGGSAPLSGIELKAVSLVRGSALKEIPSEKWEAIKSEGGYPLYVGQVPINYLAPEKSLARISFWKILQGPIDQEQIRNKVVIVGTDREITHDVHPTPLGRMAGLAIEANGILTLLTQRFVRELPLWAMVPVSLALAVAILYLTYYATLPISFFSTILLVGLVVWGQLALVCQDVFSDPLSPVLLGSTAWLIGFFYKHGWLALNAFRLRQQAISDSLTGTFTARYFHLRLQEELSRFRRTKQPVSLILVQITPLSELLLSQPIEVAQNRIRSLVRSMKENLPAQMVMGHLKEGCLGVLLSNTNLVRGTKIAQGLSEALRAASEAVAFSLVSTDQELRRTVDDVLHGAELALARARTRGNRALETYDPTKDKISSDEGSASQPRQIQTHLEYVSSELEERNSALERALAELRQVHKELESAFLEVTKSLVLALETKDAYTAGHLERVSRYSTRLAEVLRLSKEEVEAIREAALLHDIGKIGLPDEVLHKVGALTDEERDIIRQHLVIGAKILEPMKFFKPITTLIYHHHEWYNGKGYPHGLAGNFIPSGAQVIAIADAFDAMTTNRGYQKVMNAQEALAELKRGAGTQFNPIYVDKFAEVITQEGPQLAGYVAA